MEELMTPAGHAETTTGFGAFEYFPENLEWSTQMMRLFSYCYVRGADFSEVHSVARSLPVGDNAAWQAGFAELASKVEADGWESSRGDHEISARDAFLRATIYYRISGQMADIEGSDEVPPCLTDSIRMFREACARMRPAFEPVEVPYEGVTLPGYLAIPDNAVDGMTPAVVDFGGIDAWAEEQYFKIGAALLERGYAVLLLNGPGQGEAKMRGIYGRHDFEVVAAATVDYMRAQPSVDGDRIGLIGSSLGGYFAARAAAFEPRLAATVVWGAHNGFTARPQEDAIADPGRRSSRIRQGERFLGVEGLAALIERLVKFQLGPEVMRNVSAPILIMHGESDVLVPVEDAQAVFDDTEHDDKTLRVYPAGTPGCAHCQLDALAIAQRDICDWLDEKLRR
jgi:dienelactone hydrolase